MLDALHAKDLIKGAKAGSKTIKGGIWVSGKAAKVQGVLDKVIGAGDKVHGVLTQVHEMAPGLSDMLGDNAAGRIVLTRILYLPHSRAAVFVSVRMASLDAA